MTGNINPTYKKLVSRIPGGENVLNCYLCGTCTAGCPVSEVDNSYSPRNIMRQVLIGSEDAVLSTPDIWKCSQCHICVAHCPQDARPADIIRVLRDLAVEGEVIDRDVAQKFESLENQIKAERIKRVQQLIDDSFESHES